jgi:phosphoglycolate phosphatase
LSAVLKGSGRSWQSCKALLFDKDGTLINFRLMWLGWCREVVRNMGAQYPPAAVEKCLSAWGVDLALGSIEPGGHLAIGSTAVLQQSLALKLQEEKVCSFEAEAVVLAAMRQAYCTAEEKKLVQPIEGIPEMVVELHRRGYQLAVVTTDDAAKAEDNLKAIGLDQYFTVLLGCDRVANCKPAPDLVLEACRLLNIRPDQTAVIGDTVADLQMGQAAGTACNIGVASGVTAPESLLNYADLVLESAAHLIRP